ncbi:hypothetical protein HD599_003064 [Conyzicola lurida]|uniref:Cation-transporting ATPase n=1 Tax=Conyzicola lurida TaxID=1172621 RepID=A0A841ASH1_9MICO|nr:hypothetical protein [Conyzicola lurida]MBB5844741.1 hypothetical protein [Conyzicola lurida]
MSNFQRMLKLASKALDKNGQSSSTGSGQTDWRSVVRTVADKVTGDERSTTSPASSYSSRPDDARPAAQRPAAAGPAAARPAAPASAEDRAALARYDYLLKTAAPEQLEQVHREAFARLTPAQRDQVDAQLRSELPANEQPASASPDDLARSAARGEARNPGFLKGLFSKASGRGVGGAAAGLGVGAVAGAGIGAAGGLLAAVAGGAIVSSVAAPLLEQAAGMGVDFENLANLGELGDFSGLAEGAEGYVGGLGEQVADFGSNFEIPGLGSLGGLFGRD